MHRVDTVGGIQEVGGRFRGAAYAAHLGRALGRDVQLKAGLDQRSRDGVVTAAGAKRRHAPLIITNGEAELVFVKAGVCDLGFCDIAHAADTSLSASFMPSIT